MDFDRPPLDGDNYPDYQHLLDKKYSYIFEVSRPDFLSALKEASSYTLDYASQSIPLRMSFDPGKSRIKLEMKSDTIGNFRHALPAKIHLASEDSILVGINIYYLLDSVSGFQGSSLFLHANDNKQPVQITGQESDKLAIIMPFRLEKES